MDAQDQIDTLMDYIEAKAEARLANEPARFLHYMGALLLIPRSGFVASPVFPSSILSMVSNA